MLLPCFSAVQRLYSAVCELSCRVQRVCQWQQVPPARQDRISAALHKSDVGVCGVNTDIWDAGRKRCSQGGAYIFGEIMYGAAGRRDSLEATPSCPPTLNVWGPWRMDCKLKSTCKVKLKPERETMLSPPLLFWLWRAAHIWLKQHWCNWL